MNAVLQPEILSLLPRQRAWTRAEFERMAERGTFSGKKLELLERRCVALNLCFYSKMLLGR